MRNAIRESLGRTAALVFFLISVADGFGQVSSHEPFSGYVLGAELQNAGGPEIQGYSGPWVDIDHGSAEPAIAEGSLVYGDPAYLGSTSDRVSKGADAGGVSGENSGRVYRLLSSDLTVDDSTTGTRYLSWLFRTGNESSTGQSGVYQTLALYWQNTADSNRNFDAGVSTADFGGSGYAFRAENNTSRSLGVAADGGVHLFVAKFDLSASSNGDSLTVWIDPVLGGGDPSGGVTIGGTDLRFDRLALSDYATNSSEWDEIRWGSSFDGVTLAPPVPAFLVQPVGHTGDVGESVALVTQVTGNPPPDLQWEFSSQIDGGWSPIPGAEGDSLLISDAPFSANGYYRLTAANSNGTVSSEVVEVSLSYPPPRITSQPRPVGTTEGSDVEFSVEASGVGSLSYQWRKDGVDMPGETGSSLMLTGVGSEDLGVYSVMVSDDAAESDSLPATSVVSDSVLLIFGDLGDYESGLTYRLYDVREPMDQLYPLVPGQTPNVDEKRPSVDWSGSAEFSGYDREIVVEVIADLFVPVDGVHEFRLTSSDGSELWIGDDLVIDHDGEHEASPMDGSVSLAGGLHPLRIRFFLNEGIPELRLGWRLQGSGGFETVPDQYFLTQAFVTRVVAPGKKEIVTPGDGTRPGSGAPLVSVHPEWEVETIHPSSFNPKVGALAVHPDGRLFVATFEPNQNSNSGQPSSPNGQIWALENVNGGDPEGVGVTLVGEGLFEPAGMTFIDGVLHVSQRLELTRLLDNDDDGFFETRQTVGSGWESDNYHMFHFGLIENGGYAYSTLSTSIIFSYNGLNGPNPANRGTWVRTNLATGQVDYLAGGLRTPNGIGFGPQGDVFQTDNQGSWQPASRLNHLREGHFYGHYNNTDDGGVPSLFSEEPVTPPAVYFPQNEISNSPTQPLLIPEGMDFAGDMLVGELTLGGIRRVSLEKVGGEWQGAVYRFSQGFEGGINRMEWGADGSLYVGCIGASGNWSWRGTTRGLQRLKPRSGAGDVFEIDRVEATADGFRIKYTKPVPLSLLEDAGTFVVRQWTYAPSQNYGGGKIDESELAVASVRPSEDRKSVEISVPGLKEGYVVYLKSDVLSDLGEAVWSSEAWYTLNAIPGGPHDVGLDSATIRENEPAGTVIGRFSASHDVEGESIGYELPHGLADNERFTCDDGILSSARPFDFEWESSYVVLVRATDESGVSIDSTFRIDVLDQEDESAPTKIALSNAVLPPDHVSGALVGELIVDDPDLGDLVDWPAVETGGDALVHEGFDYPAGTPLSGHDGGSGFGGSWAVIGSGPSVSLGSLDFEGADGGTLVASGNSGLASTSSRCHRPLGSARGVDGSVTYASFVADPGQNVFYWGFEFWDGSASDGNRVLQIGNESGFGVRVRNGTNKFFATTDDEAHFFVVRIRHLTGNDEVAVWIDPPLDAEPAAPDLVFGSSETGGSVGFDRIGWSDYVAGSSPKVDEIRIGETWDDVTPRRITQLSYELVSGAGDEGNGAFRIEGDRLIAAEALESGLHSARVRATDTAGNSFEQAILIWVGSGHLDSNGDGVEDGDAIRLGFEPSGANVSGAVFGDRDPRVEIRSGGEPGSFLVDTRMVPGILYWLEGSDELEDWTVVPDSVVKRRTFLDATNLWELDAAQWPRYFWRVGGGWPLGQAEDPLAGGLEGLTFVGGDSTGWTYDSPSGILRQDVADANPAEWLHFGMVYGDFVMSVEYRVSDGANAGVFVRSAAEGNPWDTGTEIQITNQPRAPIHSTGAAYGRIAAIPAVDASADVWHRMDILFIGRWLMVRVDGIVAIDEPDVSAAFPDFDWPASGLVGLQDSHNPGGSIEYRNIRILSVEP